MRWIYYKSWQISFWIALIISYLDLLLLAWVSGLPKGLGERRFLDGRVGMGEEEKGRPDTKPFSKSCDTSKIWMWQWLDNTQYSLTSPTARAIGKEKPLKFFIDVLIYVTGMWYFWCCLVISSGVSSDGVSPSHLPTYHDLFLQLLQPPENTRDNISFLAARQAPDVTL